MRAPLLQTVTSLTDGTIRWNFNRLASAAEPGEAELFLGVGTRDAALLAHPRMLSWKLPQWRAAGLRSTTEAVLRSAETLDAMPTSVVLCAHDHTLDVVTAAVLATYRLQHHRWPDSFEALVEYVSEWEQGRTERAGHYERALASVYYASMQLFRTPEQGPGPELVRLLAECLDRQLDAAGLAALPESLVPHRVSRRLKADTDLYRAELSRSCQVQIDLPLDDASGTSRRVDALFLSSPQDVTVLKLLARPDAVASSYRRGFELLAVHAPNEPNAWAKHTVTISPESPGSLSDLGVVLDFLEGDRTPSGTPRAKGAPRFSHQPAELQGLSDPWYSDGYAWAKGRSTIVAPPFAGTTLTREAVWQAIWQRFNPGRNIFVTSSRTIYVRPYRVDGRLGADVLTATGWQKSQLPSAQHGFLPSVVGSFFGDAKGADVGHFSKTDGAYTVHLSLYPSQLALVWVEARGAGSTLFDIAAQQASLSNGNELQALESITALKLESLGVGRWHVYGAYRINRARSSMLDASRSILGLQHCLASGIAPHLQNLPSEAAASARTVHSHGDVEHWFTATGGARFELALEDSAESPTIDPDFALFLLTLGQRYAAFEITRRMGEVERRGRTSRWQSLAPTRTLRGDVMLFTNSLWYARVSDDPDLEARYDAWRALHGMTETVESLRSQTQELDEYRKERFENMVGVLVFFFLPLTIVCGFFSGAQFNEMDLRLGLPWTTGGWKIFLLYTAFFTVLTFGAVLAGRLLSWRKR